MLLLIYSVFWNFQRHFLTVHIKPMCLRERQTKGKVGRIGKSGVIAPSATYRNPAEHVNRLCSGGGCSTSCLISDNTCLVFLIDQHELFYFSDFWRFFDKNMSLVIVIRKFAIIWKKNSFRIRITNQQEPKNFEKSDHISLSVIISWFCPVLKLGQIRPF